MPNIAFSTAANDPVRHTLSTAALRSLTRRALFPWLRDALIDWLVIAAAMGLFQLCPNVLTAIAAVLIVGNRQHALAILGHDGTHYTISRNTVSNDFLTNLVCFWPFGLTVSGYRALHYAHHKHTGTEHDPELGHKRMRAPQWDLPNTPSRIMRYALWDLIGFSLADYLIIVRFSKPARRREYAALVLFHLMAAAVLIACGGWKAAALWYYALPTSFMMFFRLRLWLEHQGTGNTQRLALNRWQGAILAPHNAWHHWEHHKYPTIPYHRLPAARRRLDGPAVLTLPQLVSAFIDARPIASGAALQTMPDRAESSAADIKRAA
jgi:fatty acid desaturase